MKPHGHTTIQALTMLVAISSGWKTIIVDGFVRIASNPIRKIQVRAERDSLHSVFDSIERVFCLSDLHTDHIVNMEWLQERCASESAPGPNDLVVVAGDISHDMNRFCDTIKVLQSSGSQVLFIPGNHESWLSHPEPEASSLEKLDLVYSTCRQLGVLVDDVLVGSLSAYPLWVVPLQSWYDGTLSLEGCEDLCVDFKYWPWTDFQRCKWDNFTPEPLDSPDARIPTGLAQHFHRINEMNLKTVRASIAEDPSIGLLTTSHFLPNQQCLPDWKDPKTTHFHRDAWLDHGAPGTSSKFAKVAGSQALDFQLRSLSPKIGRHIHVFGHSHRPKDFEYNGVRYVHNPLGKKGERDMYMVSPHVDFQLLWDTRTGEVRGKQIIRLWEEQGGGLEGLERRWALHGRKRQDKSGQRVL